MIALWINRKWITVKQRKFWESPEAALKAIRRELAADPRWVIA